MSYIIGISGKARSGKNYLATELRKQLPNSEIYSFANALKCHCRVAGLMTIKDGNILQEVGTDVYRTKDNDFWVRMLDYQIQEENPKIAIIADVRFPNEVKWIEDKGGINIRVIRINEDGSQYFTTDRPKDHPSEIALDNFNFENYVTARSGDVEIISAYARNVVLSLKRELNFEDKG